MSFKGLFFFLMLVAAAYGVCELPKAVGPCRAKIPRWFYSNGACEPFNYSGCKGNDNNFHTKNICEQTCLTVCELPVTVGLCRGYFERWFYSDGACKIFGYSGCDGNKNNFPTKTICEQTCLNKSGESENHVADSKRDPDQPEDNEEDSADNEE